jgi:sugar lactone lactonase YvrE
VVIDGDGNLYVADAGNATIRKITAAGVVTTLTGAARVFGSVDGTGATARFNLPSGVAVDAAGNLYVTDEVANTLRKVTAAGVVTTLAGTARVTGSADGTGAAAQFSAPSGVAVDGAGNVYVADMGNDTIRKITAAGVVTTLAGTVDRFGSADGTGTAAQFNSPSGVAVDGVGNVYVADMGNDTIRKITPTGVVTTIAGMAGVSGILLGATPRLETPSYLAIAGDSIVISELDSILVLRHGAR